MKLLDSQEVAVQRAQERNRLIDAYTKLLADGKVLQKQIQDWHARAEQLNQEVLTQLNKL